MVGSRRRRRGRGRLLQEGAEPSQLADATLICRLSEGPDETWSAVDLGQPVLKDIVFPIYYGMVLPPDCSLLSSLWVFPNLIYGSG